jgi:hypothetical protein
MEGPGIGPRIATWLSGFETRANREGALPCPAGLVSLEKILQGSLDMVWLGMEGAIHCVCFPEGFPGTPTPSPVFSCILPATSN